MYRNGFNKEDRGAHQRRQATEASRATSPLAAEKRDRTALGNQPRRVVDHFYHSVLTRRKGLHGELYEFGKLVEIGRFEHLTSRWAARGATQIIATLFGGITITLAVIAVVVIMRTSGTLDHTMVVVDELGN